MLPPVYFSVIASLLAAGAAEEVPTMSAESDYENIESTLQKKYKPNIVWKKGTLYGQINFRNVRKVFFPVVAFFEVFSRFLI